MQLPTIDHQATSVELRLRVVAQTNGEHAAAGQRAMQQLFVMTEARRKRKVLREGKDRPRLD